MSNQTPLERYQAALATGDFSEDAVQLAAVTYMDNLYHEIIKAEDNAGGGWFSSLFKSKPVMPKGLYMWGGVGRGKTWMMDMFYESLPIKRKMRMHFHHFMQRVQRELVVLQGQSDPLQKVADIIHQEAVVICFDEFFVSNVSDAMILGDLFSMLFDRGITLVATSNIEPSGLYKNGIHRDRFLPAIAQVEKHTTVMNIDAGIDYRLRLLKQAKLYSSPLTDDTKDWLSERFDTLAGGQTISTSPIMIGGRNIDVIKRTETMLLADFRALCMQPRSAADFIEIANDFDTVMVDNVPALNDTLMDPTRRFIYLVDEFYDRRVKLLIRAEQSILTLYQGEKLAFEIERTRSRLLEMQSEEYLAEEHRLD
ncbi:cell division protein ZapE [Moraxella catarrhalis]|uniref:Cell division protein ZapE n=1 Tax=Moraxella catarrhalis TaxID=480 RepID=A0AB36DPK3_MORCA|nr:cell division protein ZapE [Moraxella catarrhalis]MPX28950.1 cell division protein ZapE [Moraxella catarrhalis]OAV26294.1 putative ATPase [Moraxella catarrhalis]RKL88849.1 cell division protein ZapE [Moraxella catarrhalis]RKL90441.1 cell division protein ZapE [Moraxella catarrhalis]RKL97755.1 cell division protein ZapE [Moraxella catarrhalis]